MSEEQGQICYCDQDLVMPHPLSTCPNNRDRKREPRAEDATLVDTGNFFVRVPKTDQEEP